MCIGTPRISVMRIGLFLLQARSISCCAKRSRFFSLPGCLVQRVASRWRELNCSRHVHCGTECGSNMSNIHTIASLRKGQRTYRIRVGLKSKDYRKGVPTKRGPTNVLDATCYDSTGFILFTFWGGRADSMNAALCKDKAFEISNALLKRSGDA